MPRVGFLQPKNYVGEPLDPNYDPFNSDNDVEMGLSFLPVQKKRSMTKRRVSKRRV